MLELVSYSKVFRFVGKKRRKERREGGKERGTEGERIRGREGRGRGENGEGRGRRGEGREREGRGGEEGREEENLLSLQRNGKGWTVVILTWVLKTSPLVTKWPLSCQIFYPLIQGSFLSF